MAFRVRVHLLFVSVLLSAPACAVNFCEKGSALLIPLSDSVRWPRDGTEARAAGKQGGLYVASDLDVCHQSPHSEASSHENKGRTTRYCRPCRDSASTCVDHGQEEKIHGRGK
eukprot:6189256-Pleurochrysis_carterae.AAC.2